MVIWTVILLFHYFIFFEICGYIYILTWIGSFDSFENHNYEIKKTALITVEGLFMFVITAQQTWVQT
jgi:hypothetical protein